MGVVITDVGACGDKEVEGCKVSSQDKKSVILGYPPKTGTDEPKHDPMASMMPRPYKRLRADTTS